MNYTQILILICFTAVFSSCNQKKKQKVTKEVTQDTVDQIVEEMEEVPNKIDTTNFSDVMDGIKERPLPVLDDTNFDSFIEEGDLNEIDSGTFKIETIYPDFYSEGSKYRPMASYKLALSQNFYTVVVTFRKGDHEMESTLINYDLNGNIIDHQLVAYDEIAEGMSRTESRISENKIMVNHIFWTEKKEIEQKEYRIHEDGKIKKIDAKVLSNTLTDYTLILSVLEELQLNLLSVKTDLIVSKAMPQYPDEFIVVIPEIVDEGEQYFELNSHIVIVNDKTGGISHRFFESVADNQWVSDAIELREIKIDTAPYLISEEVRAFGIRVYHYGMSHANPYENETVSLFVKSGDTLKKILDKFSVMDYGGEWDTDCDGEFLRTEKILILSDQKTNGYFDIAVKGKMTKTKNTTNENGDCDAEEITTDQTSLLKFNGQEYKDETTEQ
ncbi:MAG: hypothetical protein R2814_11415 [Flavobacteriaceae bacterium]